MNCTYSTITVCIKWGPTIRANAEIPIWNICKWKNMPEYTRMVYYSSLHILINNPFFYSCCMLADCIAINNKLDNFDNNKKIWKIISHGKRNSIMYAWRFIIHRENRNNGEIFKNVLNLMVMVEVQHTLLPYDERFPLG